jgi:hypothetical protein
LSAKTKRKPKLTTEGLKAYVDALSEEQGKRVLQIEKAIGFGPIDRDHHGRWKEDVGLAYLEILRQKVAAMDNILCERLAKLERTVDLSHIDGINVEEFIGAHRRLSNRVTTVETTLTSKLSVEAATGHTAAREYQEGLWICRIGPLGKITMVKPVEG